MSSVQPEFDDRNAPIPAILPTKVELELHSIVLTTDEVESVLKILPVDKATGPNGLSNRILRELFHQLSHPYCSLFNQSLDSGHVPRPKCRAPLGHTLLYCQGALMPCLTKHAINSRFIFSRFLDVII